MTCLIHFSGHLVRTALGARKGPLLAAEESEAPSLSKTGAGTLSSSDSASLSNREQGGTGKDVACLGMATRGSATLMAG